ncbi:MAG: hypothetical protein DIU79_00830 [Actinobacteria bacterium]|nr:MAG: hypothetical protein DIU79_00830 [Actinomycetota bacterium]
MRTWLRNSRKISIEEIPPALRAAVEEHCAAQLVGALTSAVHCCLTHSVRVRGPHLDAPLFDPASEREHDRLDILMPRHLVVAQVEGGRSHVISARLDRVALGPSLASPHSVLHDVGVPVTARWSAHGPAHTVWLGLGDDPDGWEFLTALRAAVAAAARRGA